MYDALRRLPIIPYYSIYIGGFKAVEVGYTFYNRF